MLEGAHKSKFSTHPNATKMYRVLRLSYWSPCMKRDIAWYIERCLTYWKVKVEHQIPHDKLQSLEFPMRKWSRSPWILLLSYRGQPRGLMIFGLLWTVIPRLLISLLFRRAHRPRNWPKSIFKRLWLVTGCLCLQY